MKRFLLYGWKTTRVVLVILIVAFIASSIYVLLNKQKIMLQVTQEIGKSINGKVVVQNIDISLFGSFPDISVVLKDITVTDTLYKIHQRTFFKSKELYITLNIWRLIRQEPPLKGIRLKSGSICLYTDSTGYTNSYLVKINNEADNNSDKSGNQKNQLKDIVLKDVSILIEDQKKKKFHSFLIHQIKADLREKDNFRHIVLKTDILVNSLSFNTTRGSFIKDKVFKGNFTLSLDKSLNQLQFDSINISLSNQPFNLSGRIDLKEKDPLFQLSIYTDNILYSFIKSSMPPAIANSLSVADLDGKMKAQASISGPLKGGEPKILANWETGNTNLKTLFLDFENASFKGLYTNEVVPGGPRDDANSKIEISLFKADWHNIPVTADKIVILNLYKPLLSCDLNAGFPLTKLNELIGSNSFKILKGAGSVKLTYLGPLEKNNNTNSFLNGSISFSDATLTYVPRKVEMQEVKGSLTFKNSDVFVSNLQCIVLNNKVVMEGVAKNLLTLINTEPDKAVIDWNIYSPSLDLGSFMYLLKSRTSRVETEKETPALSAMADKIDQLLEQGKLHVSLKTDRLRFHKFEATGMEADISLLQDRYLLNNVSMNHSGGNIKLSGSFVHQPSNTHLASIKTTMQNVDVSKVFYDFENFGQDGITSESLEGKLNTTLDASMQINEEGSILPASIKSSIAFSLRNGALNNYEPVKKLQRFVFKKRDFDNIRFAELKNSLEVINQEIKINRMEIQSTVLTMFVEGIYSQKGSTDISIQVPLSNLKKRDEDYNPENIGTNKKTGSSIYIRGRPGEDGNIKFKLDLFNKFEKEKSGGAAL